MEIRSTESASTPISRGGWKYNHDDEQDRADFADFTAADLARAVEQDPSLDFSDHPSKAGVDAVEQVDIDEDLRSAGAGRQFWADSPQDLWEELKLELDGVADGPAPVSGPYRRLHAALRSVAQRRDGNTRWATESTLDKDFVLRWWSSTGHWGDRAWHLECKVLVELDQHLETEVWVSDAALTVIGTTGGGATRFQGWALGPLLKRSVLNLITRDRVRELAGYRTQQAHWLDAPDAESWVASELQQRKADASN